MKLMKRHILIKLFLIMSLSFFNAIAIAETVDDAADKGTYLKADLKTGLNIELTLNIKNKTKITEPKIQKNLVVSLPYLPAFSEAVNRGVLVDLVKEMDKEYSGSFIIKEIYPFKRSIHNLLTGKADFHMPMLFDPDVDSEKLAYKHSKETIFHVIFAVYTKKGTIINHSELDLYNVETDSAHVDLFPFSVIPSTSIKQSLKKLHTGRIDAFIFAAKETDGVIQSLELSDKINRSFYKKYAVKIALRKNHEGDKLDKILSPIINKLHKSGVLKRLFLSVDSYYKNWPENTN